MSSESTEELCPNRKDVNKHFAEGSVVVFSIWYLDILFPVNSNR